MDRLSPDIVLADQLADRADPHTGQPGARDSADAPDESDRERVEERALLADRDDDQPVRLRELRVEHSEITAALEHGFAATEPDRTSLMQYAALLAALSAILVFTPLR